MTRMVSTAGTSCRGALAVAVVCGAVFSLIPPTRVAEAATPVASLTAISCRTADLCLAVGFIDSLGVKRQPFSEQWDGGSWQRMANPSVPGGFLESAACVSASDCVAVGEWGTPSKAFAEHWNGTRWTVTPTPSPGTEGTLSGVSCASAKFCIAVGSFLDGKRNQRTLILRWNGSTWKQVASPNYPKRAPANWLDGVSCMSVKSCVAVGSAFDGVVADAAYVVGWNGKVWSIRARQEPTGDLNWLHSVSCAAQNMCLTVGEDNTGSPTRMLKGRWNGKTWRVTAPPPADRELSLNSVSCADPTNCLAVGAISYESPYAERWFRNKWLPIAAPAAAGVSPLVSVSCVRSGGCYAVAPRSMQYWNGSSWSVVDDARQ
jgi:hypothetical protein